MPANTSPIFTLSPDIQWSTSVVISVNATTDLTTGTIYLVFTADATNGGYVQKIRFRAIPGGNNVATVARVWINNGAATGTATNNILFDELTLAATTANNAGAVQNYELPLAFALPAGYRIYVTLGTVVATGYAASIIGGKY